MLPEFGPELIFVAIVALIVVGPKDLPILLRKVGQFTAKMRGLAAEFRSSFDELARQSELDELRKEVEAIRQGGYVAPVRQEIEQHFEDLHKEFGAPPPPPLTEEGVITPGPDAPAATYEALAAPAAPAASPPPGPPSGPPPHPIEPEAEPHIGETAGAALERGG